MLKSSQVLLVLIGLSGLSLISVLNVPERSREFEALT